MFPLQCFLQTNPPDMTLSTTANTEYDVIPNFRSATNPPDMPFSTTANAAYGVITHGEYDVIPNQTSSITSNPTVQPVPLPGLVVQGQGTGGDKSTHEDNDDGQMYEN